MVNSCNSQKKVEVNKLHSDHSSKSHTEPDTPLPEIQLDDLPEALQSAARRAGWSTLMPVQSKAIPYVLEGRDLMVQSQTGSGKTGAFVLPILQRIDPTHPHCQALVMVPTRELARQVTEEAKLLSSESSVRTVPVYGGVSYGPQTEGIRKGAHLMVGTPGRILDHLMRGNLDLDQLKVLIFDEADKMMSMGFYPDMKQLKKYLPRQRSGFMFSATFPRSVRRLAGEFLKDPPLLSLSHESVHVSEVDHIYYVVPAMDKDRCLVRIIEVENPASAMIFCNTRATVNYVSEVLKRFGYDADQITADLHQGARERVLNKFRKGQLRFLVATDLAARGIDIVNMPFVFIYDFPEDQESYIHRAGRTGRAGAGGIAISLVDVKEELELKKTASHYDIEMQSRSFPSDEEVQSVVSERMTVLLESKLRTRDRLHQERMQRMIPLARSLGESEDELTVIAMLLDDHYQESLHAPPELPDEEQSKESSPSTAQHHRRKKYKRSQSRRSS